MPNRRQMLQLSSLAIGVALLPPILAAEDSATMSQRNIGIGDGRLPVIGMGTSGSFEVGDDTAARGKLRDVLLRFAAGGGRLIDTSPSYGSAEGVLGDLLLQTGLRPGLYLATKLSGVSGRDAGFAQFAASLRRLQTDRVELLQVHNLGDWRTQLAVARELQKQGKVRHVGLTHYLDRAHDDLTAAMIEAKPDFVQINYSVTQRNAEQRLFPAARDHGIAVIANRNFDDGALFQRVAGKPVPAWAIDAGITSWAQLFLKFALSHPAVTAVIPATGKPERQSDNLRAGSGAMLDEQQRALLIAAVG